MEFGIHSSARIHPTACISELCYIGRNVEIGPGAVLESYTHLGDEASVGPGAIIGACGHFFKYYTDGLFKVEHAGGVWVSNAVHILAGAVVQKAAHPDFTLIGEESVVGPKAHIAHGCRIGARCILAGNVQVSGFSALGDDVWVGPSATITNLAKIGDRARIEIGSVVVRDVGKDEAVSGNFAYSHRMRLRDFAMKEKA